MSPAIGLFRRSSFYLRFIVSIGHTKIQDLDSGVSWTLLARYHIGVQQDKRWHMHGVRTIFSSGLVTSDLLLLRESRQPERETNKRVEKEGVSGCGYFNFFEAFVGGVF